MVELNESSKNWFSKLAESAMGVIFCYSIDTLQDVGILNLCRRIKPRCNIFH